MKTDNILVRELLKLNASYRAGAMRLPALASRSENLVEHLQSELSAEDFTRAINCVYLFEEINALILDENRRPSEVEEDAIRNELTLLEKIIARSCEEGEIG